MRPPLTRSRNISKSDGCLSTEAAGAVADGATDDSRRAAGAFDKGTVPGLGAETAADAAFWAELWVPRALRSSEDAALLAAAAPDDELEAVWQPVIPKIVIPPIANTATQFAIDTWTRLNVMIIL